MKARVLSYGLAGVCILGLSTGCFSTTPAKGQGGEVARTREPARCISPEEAERMADQVLQLINLERASADPPVPPVAIHPRLNRIASTYACRMIEEDFFAHRDPLTGHGPRERAIAGKYYFYAVGENLAAGQQTPAEVMEDWMASPAHRAIILDETWTDVGVVVRAGRSEGLYWVLEFGDPAHF